jgi:hypothetical protein
VGRDRLIGWRANWAPSNGLLRCPIAIPNCTFRNSMYCERPPATSCTDRARP